MKTIEITDEMYDSLMEISNELNTQSHRCTAMPYMIQLIEKEEVAAYNGCGDEILVDSDGLEIRSLKEGLDLIKENDLKVDEISDWSDLKYELEDHDFRAVEVTENDSLSNFFFTDKGLRDYYGKDVNTFLTGVTNPELKTVMTFLCELNGGKLHR
tara:strand:- start:337 stop:804 length:468 start_codon:yes stop_codon:yes gene_type:complete